MQDCISRKPLQIWQVQRLPSVGQPFVGTTLGTSQNFSFQSGHSTDVRYNYVMDRTLNNLVDAQLRPRGDRTPIFVFFHDFGSATSGFALYTVGTIQNPIMGYPTSGGVTPINPLWTECYSSMLSMIKHYYLDYATAQALGSRFDGQLKGDVTSYYTENVVVIYSNSTSKPTPPYANLSVNMYINRTG
jgi:hypothetical protein